MVTETIPRLVYRAGHTGMVGTTAFVLVLFGHPPVRALGMALLAFLGVELLDLWRGRRAGKAWAEVLRNGAADLVDATALVPVAALATGYPRTGFLLAAWVLVAALTWRDGGK